MFSTQETSRVSNVNKPRTSTYNVLWECRVVAFTVEDLLHGLVAHLCGGEALQRDDGWICAVTQQQPTCLQMTGQSRPVQSRLSQSVHCVQLCSYKHWYKEVPDLLSFLHGSVFRLRIQVQKLQVRYSDSDWENDMLNIGASWQVSKHGAGDIFQAWNNTTLNGRNTS